MHVLNAFLPEESFVLCCATFSFAMPRTYKKKGNSGRGYKSRYTTEQLSNAISAVVSGRLSQKEAASVYSVPRRTLGDKINKNHTGPPGRAPTLLPQEETQLVNTLNELCNWGFPLTVLDVQLIIKGFFDRKGVRLQRFKNNLPGRDFVYCLMKRNNLVNRTATNIKRSRAAVSPRDITEFFERIKIVLEGSDSELVYNYDETAFVDDPGSKLVICRRGTRRVERVKDHSKTSTSVMVCGSASGELLPPRVVYKAGNLYHGWCEGGPENATYAATPSGWFDGNQFELWFENNFLPFIEARHPDRGNKPIVLLGDNLASHYSPHVIETAADLNIYFACFPANATHLLQPLDVGFFKPFKQLWRKILDDWKVTTRAVGAVPKEYFPSLLKRLWDQVETKKEATLQASFRTTGLYPFNPSKVLDKLPGGERQADDGDPLNDSPQKPKAASQ